MTNPFAEYGYDEQNLWIGRRAQLIKQDVEPDYYVEYGKGFIPGSPEPSRHDTESYLTFTANEDGSSVGFGWYKDTSGEPHVFDLQYRLGDGDWEEYTINNIEGEDVVMIPLDAGQSVQFKGNNPTGCYYGDDNNYTTLDCTMEGSISGSGDVTSLMNGVGGDIPLTPYCFIYLFSECESLTSAPNLPSTTLAEGCYSNMFSNCTSLTTVPVLPASTLVVECYDNMFTDCTLLNEVTCLATDITAENALADFLTGVSHTGTFIKSPAVSEETWREYCYFNPGWEIVDYTS
ncbi:MAG: hypothetical protein J6X18_13525 [Bacteroidales bacterium]|nr:hypothetical protein [Bacteroidales bacterium]